MAYRGGGTSSLLDPLASTLDDLGVGVVKRLLALGFDYEMAMLVVSAGQQAMLRTYEALQKANEEADAKAAGYLSRRRK